MTNRFLTFRDYAPHIQDEDLAQITEDKNLDGYHTWNSLKTSTRRMLLETESIAQEEIASYLRGRYIIDELFAPTQDYTSGATYFGKNLVTYTESKFDYNTVYNPGDRFSYRFSAGTFNNIYEVLQVVSATTPSNVSDANYNLVCENNALFYANLPCAEFDQSLNYQKGQLVWYQDHIYQALNPMIGITPAQSMNLELRYGIPSVQSYQGVYPVDFLNSNIFSDPRPVVNTSNWSLYSGPVNSFFTGSTYYFSGGTGTTPDNATYWTQGDNRNPQIVMYYIDILLYHLHSRINPRNIPELRSLRYNGGPAANDVLASYAQAGAIGWLKNIEKGKVHLDAPEIIPAAGGNIRWGSYEKRNNSF